MNFKRRVFLSLYYSFAYYLPVSHSIAGRIMRSKNVRYVICKNLFKSIGKNVNIEKGVSFGDGRDIIIGNNSGLGVNCSVPNNIIIGNDVMMGPNCMFLGQNHEFINLDIPMRMQGYRKTSPTIIEDDVWIGYGVIATPQRTIRKGTIIAAGCVLSKDFPEYSIIGGNPSKLIKNRKG